MVDIDVPAAASLNGGGGSAVGVVSSVLIAAFSACYPLKIYKKNFKNNKNLYKNPLVFVCFLHVVVEHVPNTTYY